jgi:splicing factor U2AF subunit
MKRENKFTVEELEQAIPINQRSRRNKAWDVKPQGGESLTAEMAKMSGLFPLPMQQKKGVDLTKVQGVVGTNALAQLKGEPVNGKRLNGDSGWRFNALQSVDPYLLQPSRSRVSRRVIITTSSSDNQITHERLARHFNQLFRSIEGGPESVVFSYSTTEGKIHVLEFRTTEEATLVIALNELPIDETEADSPILMIRRPKDYFVPEKPPSQSEDDGPPKLPDEDKLSDNVEESLNKLALSNLPQGLLEEQVLELLTAFGELKSFKLIKDRVHDESIGVAFCEFKDPKVGDLACQGLNDVELIGKKVKMTRVCQGIIQPSTMVSAPINSVVSIANEKETYESLVIQMFNMVTAEELVDDIEFEEIMEQIATRVSKIGAIDDLKIPRPVTGSLGRDGVTDAQNPGVGKVYVKFKSTKDSRAALETFAGAKFTGRTIVTAYYPQENFDMDVF